MKTLKFNHNDYVTVTLTKEGAEHLTRKRDELYRAYPMLTPKCKVQWKEGDVYKTQFWGLINDFDEMLHIGMMSPFNLGEIMVESSLES